MNDITDSLYKSLNKEILFIEEIKESDTIERVDFALRLNRVYSNDKTTGFILSLKIRNEKSNAKWIGEVDPVDGSRDEVNIDAQKIWYDVKDLTFCLKKFAELRQSLYFIKENNLFSEVEYI